MGKINFLGKKTRKKLFHGIYVALPTKMLSVSLRPVTFIATFNGVPLSL